MKDRLRTSYLWEDGISWRPTIGLSCTQGKLAPLPHTYAVIL
jgi:hypothetical protein